MHKLYQNIHPRILRIGIQFSLTILSLLILAFIFPFTIQPTLAEDTTAHSDAVPTISLAVEQPADLNIMPDSNGSTNTSTGKIYVSTTSNAGYSLYISTQDNSANLTNTINAQNTNSITTITSPQPLSNFAPNSWGYNIAPDTPTDNTIFTGLSNDPVEGFTSDVANANDQLNFSIAAKISTALPAGQYANNLLVSAIAHPNKVSTLLDLVYMQDMTSTLCANSAKGDEKQLIDSRDQQSYWVAKLADDKCWMTQNLDYHIPAGGFDANLAAQSDINPPNSVWTVTAPGQDSAGSTKNAPAATTVISNFPSSKLPSTINASYKIAGRWIMAAPTANQKCTNPTSYSSCPTIFLNISGSDWQPTFQAQTGTFNGTSYDYVSVDQANKTFDAHYLTGTYYQWGAATAGGSSQLAGRNANDSICPRGWRLPTAGGSSTEFTASFQGYSPLKNPVSYVGQGYIQHDAVKVAVGYGTYLWSSSPHTTNYEAAFFGTSPGNSSYKAVAMPIRCLAR